MGGREATRGAGRGGDARPSEGQCSDEVLRAGHTQLVTDGLSELHGRTVHEPYIGQTISMFCFIS
jgi:hypothetical protein